MSQASIAIRAHSSALRRYEEFFFVFVLGPPVGLGGFLWLQIAEQIETNERNRVRIGSR
jgi:hypothetical protein